MPRPKLDTPGQDVHLYLNSRRIIALKRLNHSPHAAVKQLIDRFDCESSTSTTPIPEGVILCPRCSRTGPAKNCEKCSALRHNAPQQATVA